MSGCPPGFYWSNERIEMCPLSLGFICEPGEYLRPCPLRQYVFTTKKPPKNHLGIGRSIDGRLIDETFRLSLRSGIKVILQNMNRLLFKSVSTIATSIRLLVKSADLKRLHRTDLEGVKSEKKLSRSTIRKMN